MQQRCGGFAIKAKGVAARRAVLTLKYPVLELWSDDEIAWIEVPPSLYDDLADICTGIVGDLPLLLCWRDSDGERYLFSKTRFLADRRRELRASAGGGKKR